MAVSKINNKTISVIVPVYNSGTTAINSINSILNQSVLCDEIIIIDDGSTDNSYELLCEYFGCKKNIKIVKIKNRGAAGARNFGISIAKGHYVAFLDSDDTWSIEKIEKQLDYLEDNPDVVLIGCLTNLKNFNADRIFKLNPSVIVTVRHLLFKNYFQTSTILCMRSVVCSVGGFPEGRTHAEEGDLFLKIAAIYKCVLLNQNLVNYDGGKSGFGVSGLSSNLIKMEIGEISNIIRCYKRADCNVMDFLFAISFSILKFFRRILIMSFKKSI